MWVGYQQQVPNKNNLACSNLYTGIVIKEKG